MTDEQGSALASPLRQGKPTLENAETTIHVKASLIDFASDQ
jgi:hypothetical protein